MSYEANVYSNGGRFLLGWPEGAPLPNEGQCIWFGGSKYKVLRVEYIYTSLREPSLEIDIAVVEVEE